MKCEVWMATGVFTYVEPPKPKQFAKLLEVGAANEVLKVNTLNGTYLVTSSATGTLIIIDYREIILNLDGAVRTGLLALHTTDTAVVASLAGNSTLIVAGALNYNASALAKHMNNTVGTGLSTEATADTLNGINLCNAIFLADMNSILRANRYTVAVAKAGVGAGSVARIIELCSLTGLNTVVNVLSVLGLAVSVTSNISNLCLNVACRKSHDLTELSSNVSTAGDTEAGIVALALTESLCVSVTARVAAGTAVCAGETVTNCNDLFIFLNCKEGSSNSKNYCANKSNYCKNN